MTRDDIIRMAEEAGAKFDPHWGIAYNVGTATFERFAALVAPGPNEDYERGFVDGMQEQMKTSVDRAVNATCKREWVGLTEIEICDIEADELTSASSETFSFARAIEAKLKEKNGG
jgi:hypothetical protein